MPLATHHARQVRLSVDVARLASLGVKGAAGAGGANRGCVPYLYTYHVLFDTRPCTTEESAPF